MNNQIDFNNLELALVNIKQLSDLNNESNMEKIKEAFSDLAFQLENNCDIRLSSLHIDLINKNDRIYIGIRFKDSNYFTCKDTWEIRIDSDKENSILNEIKGLMEIVINGSKSIDILNKALIEHQRVYSDNVLIQYKFGLSSKNCSLWDWDYSTLRFRLSKTSLLSLATLYAKDISGKLIVELINESFNSGNNIIESIKMFNNMELNNKIGAVLNTNDGVESILLENMLSTDDVMGLIKKQLSLSGVQEFKSVFLLKELGKFIVLLSWEVDYTKKLVKNKIVDEKVLDIENNRFISDPSIYSRIEHRVCIGDEVKAMLFES